MNLVDLHPSLIETLTFYRLEKEKSYVGTGDPISGFDMITWSVAALEIGYDSPSLRVLAGFPFCAARGELEPDFIRALHELEIDLADKDELARLCVMAMATRILSGDLSPDAGATLIHSRVVTPVGHPEYLRRWCFLWEGNPPDTLTKEWRPISPDEREELIVAEAKLTVERKFFGDSD